MTDNILVPLQMRSTYVELPEEQHSRLATGYGRRMPDGKREVMPFWDAKGMAAAGGMFSTTADLAKYVAWQMRLSEARDKEILEPTTWRNAQRVQWVDPEWKEGWGLGFHIVHRPQGDLVRHGRQVPGYFSTTYRDPQRKLAVIVLTSARCLCRGCQCRAQPSNHGLAARTPRWRTGRRMMGRRSAKLKPMSDITHILAKIESGDPAAAGQLPPLAYNELRRLAAAKPAHEKPGYQPQLPRAIGLTPVPGCGWRCRAAGHQVPCLDSPRKSLGSGRLDFA